MTSVDIAASLLRFAIGTTMLAHGFHHAWGAERLRGTAGWFESIGIRPGRLHALMASVTELGAGGMLLLGLFVPVAAAGVVGAMTVALVANHLRNGYFIFRPGEGFEYVLFISLTAVAAGALGGGRVSVDEWLGWQMHGWHGAAISAGLGAGGAALLLVTCWRPRA